MSSGVQQPGVSPVERGVLSDETDPVEVGAGPTMGRVEPVRFVLLVTSPRVPAGLLTAEAWRVLGRLPVFAGEESPLVEAVRATGVAVKVVAGTPRERLAAVQAAGGEDAVWLGSPEDEEFPGALSRAAAEGSIALEILVGSWDPRGARLLDAVAAMDRLRAPGGCPWDAEQTHTSLMPYLLEEAYEAYDALAEGDQGALREELGDVLLQVIFHACLAEEADGERRFTIDDVAGDLVAKLVHRHPHVFADLAEGESPSWDELKQREKARTSALDGVARSQPALALVAKYVDRVASAGLDLAPPALPEGWRVPETEEALGDLLSALAAAARREGFDAEAALRAAADRYAARIRAAETPDGK
jgi:XTP/dITP diphosphohydrolase